MIKPIVLITGASGFIGSAICLDLDQDFQVIAIDRREPSEKLLKAAPKAIWHKLDIADKPALSQVFSQTKSDFGRIDFIIHLAAYYDFDNDWVEEYQITNVDGTANVLDMSKKTGVKRFIFASSIGAMEPPARGSFLTEESPISEFIPYARSKFIGEKLVREAADQFPCLILRIAGVFSDWCELPPLHSLINIWTSGFPKGRLIPGRGGSGIPYIHITDLIRVFRKCILLHKEIGPFHIFLASQQGAVLHRQLYPAIRSAAGLPGNPRPIHLSKKIARIGLWFQSAIGTLSGYMPFERPWMLDYIDESWTIDTSKTRQILDWDCTPELDILRRIKVILNKRRKSPQGWDERNISRNERRYIYKGN